MATQRNWNPQIGPSVAHVTDTQWNVPLPMRELDIPDIRAQQMQMPRGRGISATPHGYRPGENPLGMWRKGSPGKQRQRNNGRRQRYTDVDPRGPEEGNEESPVANGQPRAPQPGGFTALSAPGRQHNLYNVRSGVIDVDGIELPGTRAPVGQRALPELRQLVPPRYRQPSGLPAIGSGPLF